MKCQDQEHIIQTNKSKVPLGKIGTSKRNAKSTQCNSPGPGAYNQKGQLKNNGWTIQGKRKERRGSEEFGPGPTSYFPKIKNQTPAWTLGGKNKNNKERPTDGPGPSVYFPSIQSVKPRPKSATFTAGRKDEKRDSGMPGPGNYNVKSSLGGPKYGITGKPKTSKKDLEGPGP